MCTVQLLRDILHHLLTAGELTRFDLTGAINIHDMISKYYTTLVWMLVVHLVHR